MVEDRKKHNNWQFFFEKENIYSAHKEYLPIQQQHIDTSQTIDEDDFSVLMKILGKGKFNW